jgi:deoxyribodipyrimidine photolyase-related protein
MSQFADGGLVATKPYISSAKYIQKMSDYCDRCDYDWKNRSGDLACPFNSLYWNFFHRHRGRLEKNPRVGMMYRVWDRMKKNEKKALKAKHPPDDQGVSKENFPQSETD